MRTARINLLWNLCPQPRASPAKDAVGCRLLSSRAGTGYLLELLVLAVFSYGLYRIVKALVVHQLPRSLDELDVADDHDEPEENA